MYRGLAKIAAFIALAAGLAGAPVVAAPLIDGSAADWGVFPKKPIGINTTRSDLTVDFPAYGGPGTFGIIGQMVEDTDDTWGDTGFVGPNQGGQNYDAELMAVGLSTPALGTLASGRIYMLIVSGLRPDNGFSRFGPGDIHICQGLHTLCIGATKEYGIEVGGGAGDRPGPTTQVAGDPGSTYTLNPNAVTIGHDDAEPNHNSAQVVGSIWDTSPPNDSLSWFQDPIPDPTETQLTARVGSGATLYGMADYVATWNDLPPGADADEYGTEHSVIELSFDAAPFINDAGDLVFSVYWGPSCGNDVLEVQVFLPESPRIVVPEPMGIGFLVVGLGLISTRLRSKFRKTVDT